MGDRQERRLKEKRRRQRQRQRAKTDRVAARNQARADVAASTGTRSGERWAGTVETVVDRAADLTGQYLDTMNDDDPSVGMAAGGVADLEQAIDEPAGSSSGSGFDPVAWAQENPVAAGLAGVGIVGALGVMTGAIKLPR